MTRNVAIIRAIILLVLLAIATPVYATEPCRGVTKADFIRKVFEPSDLVVVATVVDYSNGNASDTAGALWTKVTISRIIKGNAPNSEILINAWQSVMLPFYSEDKGSQLLLSLKKVDKAYELTDNDWKECTPSLITMTANGKIYPFIGDSSKDINKHRGITIDEFIHYISQ